MSMLAANRLTRRGYGKLDNGAIVLIVGQKIGFLRGIVVSDTNGDPLPKFAGGLTDAELDAELLLAEWYTLNSVPVLSLIENSVDPITGMEFTFQNGDTVLLSDNGFDATSYSAQDQLNYAAAKDLFTFLVG